MNVTDPSETMTATSPVPTATASPPAARGRWSPREAAVEQALVAATQVAAGVGNFAFAALAARALDAPGFAALAAFLAIYMVIHVPSAAVAAARAGGGALPWAPTARSVDRLLTAAGAGAAAIALLLAGPLATLTGLPAPLVVLLAGGVATAPMLGVARGRAYAAGDVGAIARSLVAEPAARIGLGLPLALAFGTAGAAVGPVVGGWIALAAARRARSPEPSDQPAGASPSAGAAASAITVAAVFVALAVLQAQDLLLANRLLAAAEASRFAVLSTIGGIVAFATATIPYVLLPRARNGKPEDLRAAVFIAAVLGIGATATVALLPAALFTIAFGADYEGVDGLALRYLIAMTALGVARVIAADRCARGHDRAALLLVALAALVQATSIVLFATTAGGIANATLIAHLLLVAGLLAVRPEVLAWLRTDRAAKVAMLSGVAVAFLVRLVSDRGLWVDEAITAHLANQSFDGMLHRLRSVDVHPPLHASLVWFTAQLFGTSELAVRLPSMMAGAALLPVVFAATSSIYDRRTAIVAASLTGVAPLLVWYSQEARMYSLFMLLAMCSLWAQVEAVRTGRRFAWAVFAVTTAAMVWTQYFTILFVAVQHIALAIVVARALHRGDRQHAARVAKGWVAALGIVLVLLVPLVPFVGDQLAAYRERRTSTLVPSTAGASATASASEGISIYAVFANGVWAVLGFHADQAMAKLVALWPLLMLVVLGSLGRRRQRVTTYLAVLAVAPAAVLLLIGLQKRDLFELRYFAASAPLAVMLGARAITTIARARTALVAATLAATAVLGIALADQQLNGANPRRYDFKGALAEIEGRAQPGDTVVYAPVYLDSVIGYYGPGMKALPVGRADPPTEGGVFVLATFRTASDRAIAGQVGDELARLDGDRDLVHRFDKANVRVWEFR